MSLLVKAFYESKEEDGSTSREIRRFPLDKETDEFLRNKIPQAFPTLKNKKLVFSWRDSEGDLITFSSNEELEEALRYVQGNVFKVHVKVQDESHGAESGVIHPSVTCDVCEGPVHGRRYKCLTCPDYDLCAQCEATNAHAEHPMVRYCTPQPFFKDFGHFAQHGHFMFGHAQHGFPPHNPHGPPPPPHPHGPPPPPPHFHPPPPHWDPRSVPPQWRDWMQNCMKTWWGGNADKSTNSAKNETSQDKPQSEKTEASGSQPTPERYNNEEYLKAVGKHVAAILDPLGIDVAVDVKHGGQLYRCADTPKAERDLHTGTKDKAESQKDENDVEMAEEETGEKSPNTQPAAAKDDAIPLREEKDPWTFLDPQAAPESIGEVTRQSEQLIDVSCPAIEQPVKKEADAPPLGPEPKQRTTVHHANPRVQESLNQMLSMGFSDNGGCLTHLLEQANGSISDVLEIL